MRLYLDLSLVLTKPARWAVAAGTSQVSSRASDQNRVLAYLAREYSSLRKAVVWRKESRAGSVRACYGVRPWASVHGPGPFDGQWLSLICEYHESTRALVVVDREVLPPGALGERERAFAGDVAYDKSRLSSAYCDSEAAQFLRQLPPPAAAEEGDPLFSLWREYLDWRRRMAETKAGETVVYDDLDTRRVSAVSFRLREGQGGERLRQRWRDEDLRVSDDRKDLRAPQGRFRRVQTDPKGRVWVEVDFAARPLDVARLPRSGVLRVAMEGEIAQLDVQAEGLRRLEDGRAAHPRLKSWLSDPGTVAVTQGKHEGVSDKWIQNKSLNNEQRRCVEQALGLEEMMLLWGPPGTGKTTVIAEICLQYLRRGQRVLVASQANLAVEQALARLPFSPEVRAVWVSTARRREGAAGAVGEAMAQWLASVAKAVRARREPETHSRAEESAWTALEDVWLRACEAFSPSTVAAEDEALYLRLANVVGATCNEAGKTDFIASPRFASLFDLVIVDEVSKATPPELIPPLLLGKKVLLVGDHRQLPPLFRDEPFEEAVETRELAQEDVDRFRSMVTASWFEEAYRRVPDSARASLLRQYRMHPVIMDAVNTFYLDQSLQPGAGRVELAAAKNHAWTLKGRRARPWLRGQSLAWVDTSEDLSGEPVREERVGTSRRNRLEAELCVQILQELASQPGARSMSVAVISFYKAQIGWMRERMRREPWLSGWLDPDQDVNTVDAFQGSERDIVIVSLVRAEGPLTGEFARDFRRINVAFSRARRLLIILGSGSAFADAQVKVPSAGSQAGGWENREVYREIHDRAARDGAVTSVQAWQERTET